MSESATLSSHVLDLSRGRPAAGLRVTFEGKTLSTDDNGRIADLGGAIAPGRYQLQFEVGRYFGATAHLFETVILELRIDEARHYHVPLLISPYSCTSYRGS